MKFRVIAQPIYSAQLVHAGKITSPVATADGWFGILI